MGLEQEFQLFGWVKLEKNIQADSVPLIRTHIVKWYFVRINDKYLIRSGSSASTLARLMLPCENKPNTF